MPQINAIRPDPNNLQERCDFCGSPPETHRFLIHSPDHTVFICNFCVMGLHLHVVQIDTLRFMPMPEFVN